MNADGSKTRLRARVTEYVYPPIHDILILGRTAPLGMEAFRRAVGLLVTTPFECIAVTDDVVGSVIVRASILKRILADRLLDFTLRRLKPLMTADEILHVDLQVGTDIEDGEA